MPSPAPAPTGIQTPPRPWWDSRWAMVAGMTVLAALLLAAYSNSFKVPYLLDDEDSIGKNETIRSLTTAFLPPSNSGITVSGRPLLNFTLAINHLIHGDEDPFGYHVGNLLIHFAAALALFGVVRRTLRRPILVSRFGHHATPIAFAAAALWALHPLQTESVTYIIQRAESLVGLCYLFTTYAFIRSVEEPSRKWTIITIVSCFLGMAAKEVMATAPLMLLLYDRTFVSGSFADAWRKRKALFIWLAASWLLLLGMIIWTGSRGSTVGFGQVTVLKYVQTQIPAVCQYLRLAFWPLGLTFDYGAVVEERAEVIIPALLVMVPLVAATIIALFKRPMLGYLGAWVFVILAPTSTVVPVATQLVAEHRIYTSLAAVAVAFVLLLHRLNAKHCWWALTAVAAALAISTHQRNVVYQSNLSIWEDTVAKSPVSIRALTNLAAQYLTDGRPKDAVRMYQEAVDLIPDAWTLTNLAVALTRLGEVKEGLAVLQRAVEVRPTWAQYRALYGNALLIAKQPDEAIASLKKAVELEPKNSSYRFDLANAYSQQDRNEEAEVEFREVLRLSPKDAEAMTNYGAMLRRMGRLNESISILEEALAIKPKSARVHSNLGVALMDTPGKNDAVQHLLKALEYEPNLAQAHYNLALHYAETGNNDAAIHHFEALFKVEAPTAEALSNLAVIYARADRLRDAHRTLKRALEVDPSHATARANFERIDAYLRDNPEQ